MMALVGDLSTVWLVTVAVLAAFIAIAVIWTA